MTTNALRFWQCATGLLLSLCLLVASPLYATQARADDTAAVTLSGLPDSALDEGQALGSPVSYGKLRRTIRRMSSEDLRGLVTGATLDPTQASYGTAYMAGLFDYNAEEQQSAIALVSGLDLFLAVTKQNGDELDRAKCALAAVKSTDPCLTGGCSTAITGLSESNLKLNGAVGTLVDLIQMRAGNIDEINSTPTYGGRAKLGRDSVRGIAYAVVEAQKAIVFYGMSYEQLSASCTDTGCAAK